MYTLVGFVGFTALVAIISWYVTRKENLNSATGYFLGGRSLNGWVIGASLILTNISAEQLVGLNGQGFKFGIFVMAWSTTAAIGCVGMALFFLPKYLQMGITTIPQFLARRFDDSIRRLVSMLSLLGLCGFGIPVVLYAGSVAIMHIIDVGGMLGVDHTSALWITTIAVTVIGATYAIFGGLKAVAVSDTVNGFGLLTMGLAIPALGLIIYGDGSLFDGAVKLALNHPEKLNAIGDEASALPFSTLFTGMFIMHFFAWCVNQSFIQRTLGARSLEQGQKGVLFAAFWKILAPAIITLPGIVAFALYADQIEGLDSAYSVLVKNVLPEELSGIYAAVLFGSVLSTFNSQLNSASTLFCMDIYKPYINPKVADKDLVKYGKMFGTIVAITGMLIAPVLINYGGGLFDFARKAAGYFNVPVLIIVFCAIFTKRVPAKAVKVSTAVFIPLYTFTQLVNDFGIHFLHITAILTVLAAIIVTVITKMSPQEKPMVPFERPDIDLTQWRFRYHASSWILVFMVSVYMLLSPMGVVTDSANLESNTDIVAAFFVSASIIVLIASELFTRSQEKKSNKELKVEQA